MLYQLNFLIVTSLIAFFGVHPLYAQEQVMQSTFGSGGDVVANDEFRIASTLSQSFIGASVGEPYRLGSGLWYTLYSLETSVETVDHESAPLEFRLEQNYPNPFNPSTTIRFVIPEPSTVTLSIFDLLGRERAVLVQDTYQQGVYKVTFDASALASGVYFYRINAKSDLNKEKVFVKHQKMTLLK